MAIRAHSVYNILNKKYKLLPFTGEWKEAFAEPAQSGVWFIYGASSNGKSSFTQQLVKYLEILGLNIAYLSLEESTDHTMQQSIMRAEWKETGSRIKILEPADVNEIDKWLESNRSPNVLIIDTIQYWDLTFKRYMELKKKHSKKLFIFVSHIKNNDPDGSVATKIMRDASLKIFIQGYRAFSKGRYIGEKGYYSIWPEKEKEIWLNEKQ